MTPVRLADQTALLAQMARGPVRPVLAYLEASPAAAAAFCDFLSWHQLLGYAGYALRGCPLPAVVAESLSAHARKMSWRNDRVRAVLPALADAFERAGVPFRVLKGLHFALAYYGGMDRRSFWDLDILVRPGDFERAQEQLLGLGYSRASRVFVSERISRYFTHAFDYHRPNSIGIDLHWRLASHPTLRLDEDAAWIFSRVVDLEGRPVQALADAYALTFLLLGIVKDVERGALRLRSLVDVLLMLRAMDARQDWPAFFAQRDREGTGVLCAGALTLFFTLFGAHGEEFRQLRDAASATAPAVTEEQAIALLHPGRYAVNNKRWAARLYNSSRFAYAAWWALSLPARMVIHRPAPKPGRTRKPAARGPDS